jgi:hypothetical protein
VGRSEEKNIVVGKGELRRWATEVLIRLGWGVCWWIEMTLPRMQSADAPSFKYIRHKTPEVILNSGII